MQEQAPACDDCLTRGHYCPGLVSADEGSTHLCFACDAGDPCGHIEIEVKRRPMAEERLEVPPASPVDLAMEQHEERTARTSMKVARLLSRGRKKEKSMGRGSKLSAEMTEQIEAALQGKLNTRRAIAERFGCGYSTVAAIHNEMKRRNAAKPETSVPPAAAPPRTVIHEPVEVDLPPGFQPAASDTVFVKNSAEVSVHYVTRDEARKQRATAFSEVLRDLRHENSLLMTQIESNMRLIEALTQTLTRMEGKVPPFVSAPKPQPTQGV